MGFSGGWKKKNLVLNGIVIGIERRIAGN